MAATTKNYSIRQFLDVYLECLLLSQSISKGTEIRRGRILRRCKKSLNKAKWCLNHISIYDQEAKFSCWDLNSPSSRWWEVDRGAFFATVLKYSYYNPPIIMDVDFTAPSHLLRLQFVRQDVFSHEHIPPSKIRTWWTHFCLSSINNFYDVSRELHRSDWVAWIHDLRIS